MRLILFFCFLGIQCLSQNKDYKFLIKEQIENGSTKIAANITLLLNNHRLQANQDGYIFYARDGGLPIVNVQTISDQEYVIIGPESYPLPEDVSLVTTITVRKLTTTYQALKTYTSERRDLFKKLNVTDEKLDSLRNMNASFYQKITLMEDSLLKVVTKHYNISEKDLKSAKELMEGREKYFNEVSSCLEGYLNEGKDVKDAYKTLLAYSLENVQSFIHLDSTVNIYNKFYNVLNNNYREYENAINNYWQSQELGIGFHNIYDFAINNIHRSAILPLNDSITLKINLYIHEANKKKRQNLKSSLISSINAILPILENNLNILDSKVKDYIVRLEISNNILPQ